MSEPMSDGRLLELRGASASDVPNRNPLETLFASYLRETINEIDRLRAENAKLHSRSSYVDYQATLLERLILVHQPCGLGDVGGGKVGRGCVICDSRDALDAKAREMLK